MSYFNPSLISDEDAHKLRRKVLIDKEYLGSSIYEYMFGQYSNELYHLLFDGHSKHLYEKFGQRPSIILGRRGAGKSSYLNHLAQKKNIIPIPIKIWDFIDIVESQVEAILKRQKSIDAEKVADIWHLILITITCMKAASLSIENESVKQLVSAFPVERGSKNLFLKAAHLITKKLRETYSGLDDKFEIELCMEAISSTMNTLDEIEASLSDLLIDQNKVIILMLDNPERLTRPEMEGLSLRSQDAPRERTISGLLNLCGRINKGNEGVQIRLCIPSEQFFYLKKVSDSKKKDFNSTQLLHWRSHEILSMAAHRYLTLLTVHKELRSESNYKTLLKHKIYTRDGSKNFWIDIFEGKIVNGRTTNETPVVYLLRHSQLLPRQFLDFLNKVITISLGSGNRDLCFIESMHLKEAVEAVEYEISFEVIDAYSYSYPEANDMFDQVLPKLPILTTAKQLKDTIYKGSGAKGVQQQHQAHPQVTLGAERFLRMLIETGVYGKVCHEPKENSRGYIEAEFEYTINGVLKVDTDDQLAMHPLFSGHLSPHLYSMLDNKTLGVYPVGTDFIL